MTRKWKPSASQRIAFAKKMEDPEEQAAYNQRKADKADKRRVSSKFDYTTAGGSFTPTKEQYDFCTFSWPSGTTVDQDTARNVVIMAYTSGEKVHHDYIHIINELRRAERQ